MDLRLSCHLLESTLSTLSCQDDEDAKRRATSTARLSRNMSDGTAMNHERVLGSNHKFVKFRPIATGLHARQVETICTNMGSLNVASTFASGLG